MISEERKKEIIEEEKLRKQIKSSEKNKKSGSCLLIVVAIIIIWCIWSFSGDDTGSKKQPAEGVTATQTSQPKAETFKTYQMGQSFDYIGDFLNKKYDWLITKSEFRKLDKYTPTCGYTRDTFTSKNGKYYVITIGGKNQGSEEFNMNLTVTINLILVSKDGKKYSQNDINMLASYNTCTLGINSDTANPGSSAAHVAVFDVPEQEYKVCDQYMKNVCIEGIK